MTARILVLGANGFIGAHVAARLARAGFAVRAGARSPEDAARRAPLHEWERADFARLTTPEAWAPLLAGVDAVVNCVGVLQDGGGDSLRAAHVEGPRALIAACEAAGVKRLIHLSAVGADADAGTAYAASKLETEQILAGSALDWLILRPSLVVGRGAFGGTGLIRALAAFPLMIPMVGGEQAVKPVAMADLVAAVAGAVQRPEVARLMLDITGPESLPMKDLLRRYRAWLGLASAPVIRVPRALAATVVWGGDFLARLDWFSPLTSTSMRQMDHDIAGQDSDWAERLGVAPEGISRHLALTPASVQDVWHARLWFVRPLAIAVLSVFWTLSGIITLGPGWERSVAILEEGGHGRWSEMGAGLGAVVDIALGLGILVRRWTPWAALGMIAVTLVYLAAATLTLPHYWLDPLGPWLKVIPAMVLCLFVMATEARR